MRRCLRRLIAGVRPADLTELLPNIPNYAEFAIICDCLDWQRRETKHPVS